MNRSAVLLPLLLLTATACRDTAEAAPASTAERKLSVLLTAANWGEIEPCG